MVSTHVVDKDVVHILKNKAGKIGGELACVRIVKASEMVSEYRGCVLDDVNAC